MTLLHQLGNGVRVIALPMRERASAGIGVFVRWGSAHESRALAGIGHVLEHMAFKGTVTRDARRINLDAERLGAEVNAHTDKDHTAYHMQGMGRHAGELLRMLADIVLHATMPADELERERQVLLQEFTEVEDDPLATAFTLFDRASFGTHPAAMPVIGTRSTIERVRPADLLDHKARGYTGCNLIVGAAGDIDPDTLLRDAEAAFGALPRGEPNVVPLPEWQGGISTKGTPDSNQTHVVLGFPLQPLRADDLTGALAAAVLGEGMSSPLLDSLRERKGLAYYSACSADVLDMCGQFVIEASTAPESVDELIAEAMRLLRSQAKQVEAIDLERAKAQLAVRRVRNRERVLRSIEDAALDAFALGRVRGADDLDRRFDAIGAGDVRSTFESMLAQPPALALSGKVARGSRERLKKLVGEVAENSARS